MFRKVLVANRGEIAVRIIRTCKRLGIPTVAVFSEADAGALHVGMADEAYAIGPSRAQESYLSVAALSKAIQDCGCDAVHPGYGLLSEDAKFAASVRQAGVVFVGPSEQCLETFGDKLSARRFAAAQGVASSPGTEEAVDPSDTEQLAVAAAAIGYPLLVKAAAGRHWDAARTPSR